MGAPGDKHITVSLERTLRVLNKTHIPYEVSEVTTDSIMAHKGDFKLEAVIPLTLMFNAKEDEEMGEKTMYSMQFNGQKQKEAREAGLERGYEVFEK